MILCIFSVTTFYVYIVPPFALSREEKGNTRKNTLVKLPLYSYYYSRTADCRRSTLSRRIEETDSLRWMSAR